MQRITGILTFIVFMALPAGNCHAAATVHDDAIAGYGHIDDTVNICIESLADMLHDCCFEQPSNCYTVQARLGKQQTVNRRINDSSKGGEPVALLQHKESHATFASSCHTAIATSRHIRGYYIYALRHIII